MRDKPHKLYVLALVVASVTAGAPGRLMAASAEGQITGAQQPGATILQDEDLPPELVLSGFVSYLAKILKDNGQSAEFWAAQFGVPSDSAALRSLPALYGDFDESQGRRHTAALERLEDDPRARQELGSEAVLERAAFSGQVFGRWLDGLRREGHDVGAVVRGVLESRNFSLSMGFSDTVPTAAELEAHAAEFADNFQSEFGASLNSISNGS